MLFVNLSGKLSQNKPPLNERNERQKEKGRAVVSRVRFRGGIRGGDLAGSQIAITRLSKIEVSAKEGGLLPRA